MSFLFRWFSNCDISGVLIGPDLLAVIFYGGFNFQVQLKSNRHLVIPFGCYSAFLLVLLPLLDILELRFWPGKDRLQGRRVVGPEHLL